jgi:phosphomannomutase
MLQVNLEPVFKAYDVRGVYPDQLDAPTMSRIGAAFAEVCRAPSVVVGRDMRASSEELGQAFIEGAVSRGADVVDVGLVSTDALYFASGLFEMPGAMLTASHNPPEYNGIKMCRAGAAPIGQDTGLADIRRLAEQGLPASTRKGSVSQQDVVDRFVNHLLQMVDTSALEPLKVVVDAANGMAGKMVPPVFDRLPVELVPLYFELDGSFPNHPADPIQIDNLADLIQAIKSNKADLGMAFDGDADRVFLVDEFGQPASGSIITALVAVQVLEEEPGASIVYGLTCSHVVPETIRERGGNPIRSRVGHSFIKQVMAESGAAFGGEHSGHYYFRKNFRADSGLICSLFVLSALSKAGHPMSKVLGPFRRYWNSGEINLTVQDQDQALERLAAEFADGQQDWTDGLTVDFPDWWFNARASNTEPLLRLNVEAENEDLGMSRTEQLMKIISGEPEHAGPDAAIGKSPG